MNLTNSTFTANYSISDDVSTENVTTVLENVNEPTTTTVADMYFAVLGSFTYSSAFVVNSIIIMCAVKEPKLRTSANGLVVILAAYTTISAALSLVAIVADNQTSHEVCFAFACVWIAQAKATVFVEVVISVNRYVLVTKTQEIYQKLFNKKTITAVMISVTASSYLLMTFIPAIANGGRATYSAILKVCLFTHQYHDYTHYVLEVITVVIVLASYGLLFLYVKRHVMTQAKKTNAKISVILFITTSILLLTNLIYPFIVRRFKSQYTSIFGDTFTLAVQFARTVICPVVYIIRVTEFRATAKKILHLPFNCRIYPTT